MWSRASRFAAVGIGFAFCTTITSFIPIFHTSRLSEALAAQVLKSDENLKADPTATSSVFTRIAKAVIPTVVSINCIMMINASDLWDNQLDQKELQDFFGEKYLNLPVPRQFRQKGTGSGIIISEQGHILTNMHVIEKAEMITVTLADNRSFDATIVGGDPLTELAVIKIPGKAFPVAVLGNSDSVQIGEWVLAIGNPLDLRSTVTAGIISAIGRDINIISDNFGIENFIQTDATINPGNSGGALVNLKGQVIGINAAIATQSGYSQGYGFAIPINLAKQTMKDLIRRGYVVRSYLGISMQDVNEKIARALKMNQPSGIFIDQVAQDSPAQMCGLREKDILIKVDNQIVTKGNIVQSIIAQKKPGDALSLTVMRNNRLLQISAVLGVRNDSQIIKLTKSTSRPFHNLGLAVENISPLRSEELNLNIGQGILVTSVEQFSPAFDAGIQSNDIILEIDNRMITSVYGFENIIAELEEGNIYIFKMKRGDNTFHVFIEVDK